MNKARNLVRKGVVPPWGRDRRRPTQRILDYSDLFNEGRFIDDCEGPCECRCLVAWRGSRTAYYWTGGGEDPNHPVLLCDDCAEEYAEYWDEMWDDYYANCM